MIPPQIKKPLTQKATYKEVSKDITLFIQAMATMAEREGTTDSRSMDKAKAYSFRRKLYWWRRRVLDALIDPGSELADSARTHLAQTFGRRVTKEWLDLTYFKVECIDPATDRWLVSAGINLPCFGPDIVFEDSDARATSLAESRAMLKQVEIDREQRLSHRVAEPPRLTKVIDNAPLLTAAPEEPQMPHQPQDPFDIDALAREVQVPPETLRHEAMVLTRAGVSPYDLEELLRKKFGSL